MSHSSQTTGGEDRRAMLGPYLEQLHSLVVFAEGEDETRLEFGERGLLVDRWESSVLEDVFGAAEQGGPDWSAVVADGLAFQVKLLVEMATLEATEGLQRAQIIEDLSQNAVLGLGLIEEAQQQINRQLQSGQMELAKRLTAFRNKLSTCLTEIVEQIGKDAFDQVRRAPAGGGPSRPAPAPAAAAAPVAEAGPPAAARAGMPERRRSERRAGPPSAAARKTPRPAARRSRARTVRSRRPGLRKLLLGVVFLAPIVPVVLLTMPQVTRQPVQAVSLAQFKHVPAVREVSVDAPSLFVRVDARTWAGMAPFERHGLVKQVAEVAGPAGYTGVTVGTTDGRPVAQWLRDQGIAVFPGGP